MPPQQQRWQQRPPHRRFASGLARFTTAHAGAAHQVGSRQLRTRATSQTANLLQVLGVCKNFGATIHVDARGLIVETHASGVTFCNTRPAPRSQPANTSTSSVSQYAKWCTSSVSQYAKMVHPIHAAKCILAHHKDSRWGNPPNNIGTPLHPAADATCKPLDNGSACG